MTFIFISYVISPQLTLTPCVSQVFDGSSTSGLRLHSGTGFTGTAAPKLTLTASSGEMLVRFVTDALHNDKGWSASFSADCPTLRPGQVRTSRFLKIRDA